MNAKENKAVGHLEALINIGHINAHQNKFPHRYETKEDFKKSIAFHCGELDRLEIPWTTQNEALQFYNEGSKARTWTTFYSNGFKLLAKQIFYGYTFRDLITGTHKWNIEMVMVDAGALEPVERRGTVRR